MASLKLPSSYLLDGIHELVPDRNDWPLYDDVAKAIRSSAYSDEYDDDTLLAVYRDLLRLGSLRPPVNDRTSTVRSLHSALDVEVQN